MLDEYDYILPVSKGRHNSTAQPMSELSVSVQLDPSSIRQVFEHA